MTESKIDMGLLDVCAAETQHDDRTRRLKAALKPWDELKTRVQEEKERRGTGT